MSIKRDPKFVIFTAFVIASILGVIGLMVAALNIDQKRMQMAEQYGCTYLGSARDLVGVVFYNCNGEIIIKPSGQHP